MVSLTLVNPFIYFQIKASEKVASFLKESSQNASKFDWRNFQDANLKRLFSFITDIGSASLPADKVTKVYHYLYVLGLQFNQIVYPILAYHEKLKPSHS